MPRTLREYVEVAVIPACLICRLDQEHLDQLNENEREGLPVSRTVVIDWLRTEGIHHVNEQAIRRHRGNCLGLPIASMSRVTA